MEEDLKVRKYVHKIRAKYGSAALEGLKRDYRVLKRFYVKGGNDDENLEAVKIFVKDNINRILSEHPPKNVKKSVKDNIIDRILSKHHPTKNAEEQASESKIDVISTGLFHSIKNRFGGYSLRIVPENGFQPVFMKNNYIRIECNGKYYIVIFDGGCEAEEKIEIDLFGGSIKFAMYNITSNDSTKNFIEQGEIYEIVDPCIRNVSKRF